ncbi:MAG: hypothetical protein A2147_02760 [Chloroflexi bacterium RBG_16_57_8]|nr:MAG: hypothetical protein A2147_02760 [Chloroflexi bacterium RBG_16_57_8]
MIVASAFSGRLRGFNIIVTFLSFLDTPLLVPIVALYASGLGAEVTTIGLIVGVYSLTNTVASVVGGRLVDRFGAKWPLIGGLAGDALAMFAYSLARLPWHLALVRGFHGLGGGVVGPATMSITAETSAQHRRGRGMATYGMAIGMATLLGNAGGGIIGARLGYDYVFFLGGALLIVAFNLAVFMGGGQVRRTVTKRRFGEDLRRTGQLLTSGKLRLPYWSIFAQYFAFGAIVTLLPLHLRSLDLTSLHFSVLLASFAVVFVVVLLVFGHLSDSIGRVKPAALGIALAGAGVVTLPLSGTLPLMIGSMVLFGVGYGLFFPSLSALVADVTSPEEYGRATGLYHALLTVGVALGAPVMGWAASFLGTQLGLALSGIPLLVALGLAVGRLGRKQS